MIKCPNCGFEWQEPCEQTSCIELFGECISCRRFVLTASEIMEIQKDKAIKEKEMK